MLLTVKKKPIEMECVQFTGTPENIEFLYKWSNGQTWPDGEKLKVKCLEAIADIVKGDYVVKGVKGEVWPVREDIFGETYEVLN